MNRKSILAGCLLPLIILASSMFANGQGTQKNLVSHIGEEYAYPPSAIQTKDGSYVTISAGDTLRNISGAGQILWQRTLSVQTATMEYAWFDEITEAAQGYIVVGSILDLSDIPVRAAIVKLGIDGSIQWSKTFEFQEEFYFDWVSPTADGGFITRGRTYPRNRTAIVKFTANGDMLWNKMFDVYPNTPTFSQSVSDGIILANRTRSGGPEGLAIFKLNGSGSIVWKKSLKVDGLHLESMGPASDNGVILAFESERRIILVEVSSGGKVNWNAAYQLKSPVDIASVARTSDGYVISGTKFSGEQFENSGGFVIKIDSKQEPVLHKGFGRTDRNEYVRTIFPMANGDYGIFGTSYTQGSSETLFLNVNSEGIAPGCAFFHDLGVKKISLPAILSRELDFTSRTFALTAGTMTTTSTSSISPSSRTCPE